MKKCQRTLEQLMQIEDDIVQKALANPNRTERFIPKIDFCVWNVSAEDGIYKAKTEEEKILQTTEYSGFEYCPFCGRRILEVCE